jgi:hypothetical protein
MARRQRKGASNSTINRDVALLNRLMRVAYAHNKRLRPPVLHKLKEGTPRQGFFEREPFEAVRRYLPSDIQVTVTIAYTFGWRMQSAVFARYHIVSRADPPEVARKLTGTISGRIDQTVLDANSVTL